MLATTPQCTSLTLLAQLAADSHTWLQRHCMLNLAPLHCTDHLMAELKSTLDLEQTHKLFDKLDVTSVTSLVKACKHRLLLTLIRRLIYNH